MIAQEVTRLSHVLLALTTMAHHQLAQIVMLTSTVTTLHHQMATLRPVPLELTRRVDLSLASSAHLAPLAMVVSRQPALAQVNGL